MSDIKQAVVLMSGGLDSTVCAAIVHAQGYELAAMHLNYHQRTQERELQAFQDIANVYTIKQRMVADTGHFLAIGGNSLTDSQVAVSEADLDYDGIPTSYVPFRNAYILSVATSWAELLGASAIVIGAVEDDSSGYPDCRQEFFAAFQQVINTGTKPSTNIKILTPIIHRSKKGIIQLGHELKAPLHLTWSCYQNSEIACGTCDSCALRLRGFHQAGLEDPIPYENRPLYK